GGVSQQRFLADVALGPGHPPGAEHPGSESEKSSLRERQLRLFQRLGPSQEHQRPKFKPDFSRCDTQKYVLESRGKCGKQGFCRCLT
ncbi:hypothetical protein AVEN_261107-1, partial [Araneus ventricosus]